MSPGTDPTADSAGVPWQGRSFAPNPHADDDGSADPALLSALQSFQAETDATGSGDPVRVIEAYRDARVLIPLITRSGDEGIGAHGMPVDKTQELSIVSVAAPDGRAVLPVFTSTTAMAAWDGAARPIPAAGVRTAVAALSDGSELIVIDPGSHTEFVIRRPAVWALAHGEPWQPSHANPEVYRGFQESIGTELAVLDLALAPGDPGARLRGPELVVTLQLASGLDRNELDAVVSRLARRWAADDRIAVLVDSLTVSLRSSH